MILVKVKIINELHLPEKQKQKQKTRKRLHKATYSKGCI